jgi:hypothetical protein
MAAEVWIYQWMIHREALRFAISATADIMSAQMHPHLNSVGDGEARWSLFARFDHFCPKNQTNLER